MDKESETGRGAIKLINTVASTVTHLAKSALIDVELRHYSQSVVATSLWAVAFDLKLDGNELWDNLEQKDAIIEAWKQLVLEMFGDGSMKKIENFGSYILLRQKRIYEAYGRKDGCINKIYNEESYEIYESKDDDD